MKSWGWLRPTGERAAGLLLVSLATVPGLAYLSGRLTASSIATSDFLLLQEVLPDLARGGSLRDWAMPYAPYLAPDWIFYTIALFLGSTTSMSVAIFAFLQMLLLVVAVHLLTRQFEAEHPNMITACSVGTLMLWLHANVTPINLLGTSYTHAGTAIFGLAMMANTLAYAHNPARKTLIATGALVFAAMTSDLIFAFWALLPAGLALLALFLIRRLKFWKLAHWGLVIGVCSAAALPIPGWLLPTKSTYFLEVGVDAYKSWDRLFELGVKSQRAAPLLLPLAALCLIASIGLLVRGRSLLGHRFSLETRVVSVTFTVGVVLATIGAQLALVGSIGPAPRYSLLMLMLPFVLLPIVGLSGFSNSTKTLTRRSTTALLLAPILLLTYPSAHDLLRSDSRQPQRPIDCIETALEPTGSRRGITGYWDARQIQLFTNGKLVMSEYDRKIAPLKINMNLAELRTNYDFALITDEHRYRALDEAELIKKAGHPLSTTSCGKWRVLDYGPEGLALGPPKVRPN